MNGGQLIEVAISENNYITISDQDTKDTMSQTRDISQIQEWAALIWGEMQSFIEIVKKNILSKYLAEMLEF